MTDSQLEEIKALTSASPKADLWSAVVRLCDFVDTMSARQQRLNPLVSAIEEIIDRRMVGDSS